MGEFEGKKSDFFAWFFASNFQIFGDCLFFSLYIFFEYLFWGFVREEEVLVKRGASFKNGAQRGTGEDKEEETGQQ